MPPEPPDDRPRHPSLPARLLIANRGEIAVRVARGAAELGIWTVAIAPADDEDSLHTKVADECRPLPGRGAAAYLDIDQVVATAVAAGADAVHPGYGFLAENAAFARACAAAGVTFVGPRPELLDLLGDKVRARRSAVAAGLAVLAGSDAPVTVEEAGAFLDGLGPGGAVVLKAVGGGGGRGLRVVRDPSKLAAAYERCASEAAASFGNPALYVEELLPRARHIEVQVLGDGTGAVIHLGERDCSIQRRHQKVLEIAPAPALAAGLRARVVTAAVDLAASLRYDNVGTIEFLVSADRFAFIEANPRIQVEHTVTEEVTGADLVAAQLRLAGGAPLASLGLEPPPGADETRVWAIQLRVNTETVQPDGTTLPSGGTLRVYEMPAGHGVRVDGYGYAGYRTKPSYDSLLAKIIVRRQGGSFADAVAKADRALSECRIEGVDTNIDFLHQVLRAPAFAAGAVTTGFVDELYGDGAPGPVGAVARRHFDGGRDDGGSEVVGPAAAVAPAGMVAVGAPMQGSVVAVPVGDGDDVRAGQLVAVLEAMKMEHEVRATEAGRVHRVLVEPGAVVQAGQALLFVDPSGDGAAGEAEPEAADLDAAREDLAEVRHRHEVTLDAARPDAVARRRATGQRTARENVADLVDPGTFVEYGPLAIAAQRRRRTVDELIAKSPADGMVAGVGSINGELFGDPTARCAVLAYDFTVFAGTQGLRNHAKTDRIIQVAEQGRLPLVLFGEGGGGRPGEDGGDYGDTFAIFAKLSGLVPMVAIVSGRCYAGNASLVGCCDVIIATRNSNIGMGGPAMIEGGGLGVYRPEEIGPIEVQVANGVVDIAVEDEADAVRVAQQYLSYFQGRAAVVGGARSAGDAPDHPGEPAARLRGAAGDRHHRRRRLGARAASGVRPRDHHRPHPGGGATARRRGQQPGAPGWRHRLRRGRQGLALHAAVRRLRPAHPQPGRHARHHGRARRRGDRPRAPLEPAVPGRRQPPGAVLRHPAAEGVRPGRDRHDRRLVQGEHVHRGLADRRVRRHGPRGGGAAGLPDGDGRHRRSRREAALLRREGRGGVPQGEGDPAGQRLRRRRHDRPGRLAVLAGQHHGVAAPAGGARREEAGGDRRLVRRRHRFTELRLRGRRIPRTRRRRS